LSPFLFFSKDGRLSWGRGTESTHSHSLGKQTNITPLCTNPSLFPQSPLFMIVIPIGLYTSCSVYSFPVDVMLQEINCDMVYL
jgi:hypothetical protein